MLIEFKFENWKSFRDETIFSTEAGQQRKNMNRLPIVKGFDMRLVPVVAIFGSNAAGKTNFFQALRFAQSFIVTGTERLEPIPLHQFKMEAQDASRPSSFNFTVLADERIFRYGFSLNRAEVIKEELFEIGKSSERMLFRRFRNEVEHLYRKDEDVQFLEHVMRATRDDQLFLTSSSRLANTDFFPVFDWFKFQLDFISPGNRPKSTPFATLIKSSTPEEFSEAISRLDTGIFKIEFEQVELAQLELPESAQVAAARLLSGSNRLMLIARPWRDSRKYYHLSYEDGKLTSHEWRPVHTSSSGDEFAFQIEDESAGTKRLFDLMPMLLADYAVDSKRVCVIDEIDRSLHTALTNGLLQAFLSGCDSNSRSQIIFTTHDAMLMDQNILRRDEMWVTERERDGVSDMWSIDDIDNLRSDKDVRKSYLSGELGGVPHILPRIARLSSVQAD